MFDFLYYPYDFLPNDFRALGKIFHFNSLEVDTVKQASRPVSFRRYVGSTENTSPRAPEVHSKTNVKTASQGTKEEDPSCLPNAFQFPLFKVARMIHRCPALA